MLARHCAVWVIFIAYELSYLYVVTGSLSNFWDYALHYLLNIAIFYTNTLIISRSFSYRPRYFLAFISILFEIIVYLLLQYLLSKLLTSLGISNRSGSFNMERFFILNTYRAFYFIGISVAYWFAKSVSMQKKLILELENTGLRKAKESSELEKNLMQAQNSYLLAQLNPHLLFNTLNFIYNSVRKVSASGAAAILHLSDMMRYSLSIPGADGKVLLENEVNHLHNMVHLNQLRYNEKLNLHINLDGDFTKDRIIPLLLISFVENLYKHGDLLSTEFSSAISLSCHDHFFTMVCINKKKLSTGSEGWGIGLQNAKARLQNIYSDRHQLTVTQDSRIFKLELSIRLD